MISRKRSLSDLLLALAFIAVLFVNIVHHQMWRDELNVYGIAHASPTFSSLRWHVNHEGHPLLWYLLIWLAIKVVPSVAALKVVQGFIGASIILMISLASPFSRIERILLLLSYFILFEYTVMSRMYGLFVLLALVFLWRRIYRPGGFVLNAMLLGLMANIDVSGLFFSGAFGLEYTVNRWRERPDKAVVTRRLTGAALIYLAMVAFCYVTVKPPADMSWRTTGNIFRHGFHFNHIASVAVEFLVLPWFPLRFSFPGTPALSSYWGPIAVDHQTLYAFFLLPVLAVYAVTFRRDRDLLATFAAAVLGALVFGFVVYTGAMRNWGITFVAFVAALWLQRIRRPDAPLTSTVLFALCAVAGVIFSILTWTRPFSNSEATAEWLQANHFRNAAIAGTPDTTIAGVAILLKRPIYYLDCRCSDDYMLFSNRRDDYNDRDMPRYTIEAFDRLHSSELILLLDAPIQPDDKSEIERSNATVELLTSFTGADAPQEDFFVYKVSRRSS